MKRDPHAVHFSSSRDDWKTPEWILDLVREVFEGEIACDPATSPDNPTNAKHFYCSMLEAPDAEHRDGLVHEWDSPWFINCPFGDDLRNHWVPRITQETFHTAREGIVLVPFRGSPWWIDLFRWATAVVVLEKRVKFKGAEGSAPFDTCLFYTGAWPRVFADVFSPHGLVFSCRELEGLR